MYERTNDRPHRENPMNLNNSKFFDESQEGRQAEAGDPGDRGLRGPRDPGVPRPAGGGHAPDADILSPRVAQPGSRGASAGERVEPGMRGPGDARVPSQAATGRGHAPDADSPPQEADRGLRGPLDDVDGGVDGGHAPMNADIKVNDILSETIVKLDRSVIGRSPLLKSSVARIDRHQQQEYIPTWFSHGDWSSDNKRNFKSDTDSLNAISDFNYFCWQGPGGLKDPPRLPDTVKPVSSFIGSDQEIKTSSDELCLRVSYYSSPTLTTLTNVDKTKW